MSSHKHPNYPAVGRGMSVHHAAYPKADYGSHLEHQLYRHDQAMLLPALNSRHNLGQFALHSLLDHTIGYPKKPHPVLMGDAVDYMRSLDRTDPRIVQFGRVINFFIDYSETSIYPHLAVQSLDIAEHYAQQKFILEHGGEAWVQALREAA